MSTWMMVRGFAVASFMRVAYHARMVRMDGKTVLSELRQNKKLEAVPVVMYSTRINPRETEEYAALGANQFLNKHNDFRGLCTSLETLLKKIA